MFGEANAYWRIKFIVREGKTYTTIPDDQPYEQR